MFIPGLGGKPRRIRRGVVMPQQTDQRVSTQPGGTVL